MKKRIVLLFIIAVCCCGAFSCRFFKRSINVSGELGEGYAARGFAAGRSISSAVTHVGAFETVTENLDEVIDNAVEEEVGEDGSFSLDLGKGEDYIILLLNNETDDKTSKIAGYVSIIDGEENLVLFPTEYMLDDVYLGELTNTDGDARSEFGLDENLESYQLSIDQLKELAQIDNTFRAVSNHYINYNEDTGTYYRVETGLGWHFPLNSTINQFSVIDAYTYLGFKISVFSNDQTSLLYEDIATGTQILEVYPPVEVVQHYVPTDTDKTFSPATPFTNEGSDLVTGFEGEEQLIDWGNGVLDGYYDTNVIEFSMGSGFSLQGLPPRGYWRVETEGNETAVFDASVTSPFDDDGNPVVPVPALKCNLDSNDKIESFEIEWYLYKNDTYQQAEDPFIIENYVDEAKLTIEDYDGTISSGGLRLNEHLEVLVDSITPEKDWYIRDVHTQEVPEVDYIHIDYYIYSTYFFFDFS